MTEPRRDRSWEHARVIGVLQNALLKFPDMRVGQLIVNALPSGFSNDAYYIEDAALADALLRFAENHATLRKALEPEP